MLGAPLHEGADRGRRGVEDGDAVARADLPEAVALGPVGRALVHQHRGAVGERSVHHVGVPGHPADVGGAPEDVVVLEVEDVLRRRRHLGEVAAGGVHDPLRLSGGARRIEDEEQVLGVHRLGGADGRGLLEQPVPPVIAALLHGGEGLVALAAGAAAHHDDVPDGGAARDRLVGESLERHHAAAAVAAVGGDEHACLGVVDPVAQRLGGEAAEHHRVHRADAGAGEHRDRRLGNHRQVDRDPIAPLHAERLQRIGGAADLLGQLPVGETRRSPGSPSQMIAALLRRAPLRWRSRQLTETLSRPPTNQRRVRRCPLEHRGPTASSTSSDFACSAQNARRSRAASS